MRGVKLFGVAVLAAVVLALGAPGRLRRKVIFAATGTRPCCGRYRFWVECPGEAGRRGSWYAGLPWYGHSTAYLGTREPYYY